MTSSIRFERAARVALSGLLVLPQAVAPATITVQGACTLPDAITAANRDVATGACRTGAGADTIELTSDVSLTRADNLDNGLPQVSSSITIQGNGFSIERASSAPRFRILDLLESGDLTLEKVTLTNGSLGSTDGAGIRAYGDATLVNSTVTGNETNGRGGGIFVLGGGYLREYDPVLTLTDSTVSSNSARRGAGIAVYYSRVMISGSTIAGNVARSRGGGLWLHDVGSGVVSHSTIAYNTAASGAGVRVSYYSRLTLTDTTISGNASRLEGGGVLNASSYLKLERSRVTNNSARDGGGVFIGTGYDRTFILDSVLSDNTASVAGGGAMFSARSGEIEVVLRNTTVSGNSAPVGGGIYHYFVYYRNESNIENSTISRNTAELGAGIYFKNLYPQYANYRDMSNSIIAGNYGPNCTGEGFTDLGNNFDDDGSCVGAAAIVPGVDFDTTLAENGGPTPTHALFEGSVAIDAAGECRLEADQRGFPRDAVCDSGAFEFGSEPLGAVVTGVTNRKVICKNFTTGRTRRLKTSSTFWLCDDLGVPSDPGNRVRLTSKGVASGAAPVGGSVSGLAEGAQPEVVCRNRTSGEKVSFSPASSSWNCEAEGLTVELGDSVSQQIRGGV